MNPQPLYRLKEFKITPSLAIPTSISRNLFTFTTLLYCLIFIARFGDGEGEIPKAALTGITTWKATKGTSFPSSSQRGAGPFPGPFCIPPHNSPPSLFFKEKTESLVQQYEAVSQLNSERYARLERAQVLVNQFWETYEELNPWIEETQALISQLPPPAIDHEQLKQQQDDMRVKRMQSLHLLSRSSALSRGQEQEHLFLLNFPPFFPLLCSFLGILLVLCKSATWKSPCYVGALLTKIQLAPKETWLLLDLLPARGRKKTLCAFRVETAKQKNSRWGAPWSCGEGQGLGEDPCQALCHSHVGKSRVPCAWQMLGHEIQGVSSSQIRSLLLECCLE